MPTIGTAVEAEHEHLVALGVRRGVELESAGSGAEWEPAEAAQVTSVGRRKATIQYAESLWQTPSIEEALRWSFWAGHLTALMLRYDAQCVRFRFIRPRFIPEFPGDAAAGGVREPCVFR